MVITSLRTFDKDVSYLFCLCLFFYSVAPGCVFFYFCLVAGLYCHVRSFYCVPSVSFVVQIAFWRKRCEHATFEASDSLHLARILFAFLFYGIVHCNRAMQIEWNTAVRSRKTKNATPSVRYSSCSPPSQELPSCVQYRITFTKKRRARSLQKTSVRD